MGITQSVFAARIGVPERDVAAYEEGTARISASKLYEVSRTLEAPVAYFFEGYTA